MRKMVLSIALSVLPIAALAAGDGGHVEKVDIDLTNKASLQRGAKYFVNYCMGCHSLRFMTYRRMADDLGLSDDQVMENLMFVWEGKKRMADYMTIAMPDEPVNEWFGVAPPDLSLVARSRGADWVYSYLKNFYIDDSRPFGVNNLVFKDVAMPHVLWELEGLKKANFKEVTGEDGKTHEEFVGFEAVREGSLSAAEYDRAVRDLVAFLTYTGEPGRLAHQRLGVWVIVYLVVLLVIVYMLKKEYWKDVH
ncbi:MAG: cytochrome c1 [Gammaproteobacteria bacterium]|nr:cytochrome c1 [Gammaproteobacteria bacterium]NIR98301.1 cytochrome c1 [Gammaproteobacteria bacterium]NIT64048.1 cytochrome c1 [Gammaproteobacteria bacterium]NIV20979.1 cytochrome c1 [Gammaproteobacteria bacterium]NIX10376.1 cytochrome c1 [Gammaproteobacteria bacterium]